jgi:hypothetical protein
LILDAFLLRKNRASRSNLLRYASQITLYRLCRLKLSFAVKVDADFCFEIGIAVIYPLPA